MSNTIGTYPVPVDPEVDGYSYSSNVLSASDRMLNGTLRTHFVAAKGRWPVTWKGLTATERDLLMVQLETLGHISWQPPEGGSFTVKVNSSSWQPLEGTQRYSVTADLEEV